MPTLQIYITKGGCNNCEIVEEVAEQVAARLPELKIEIIDLNQPGSVKPPVVFAVPTYLWGGKVISLGNPEPNWLVQKLADNLGVGIETPFFLQGI